jgi:hypothetical protein
MVEHVDNKDKFNPGPTIFGVGASRIARPVWKRGLISDRSGKTVSTFL